LTTEPIAERNKHVIRNFLQLRPAISTNGWFNWGPVKVYLRLGSRSLRLFDCNATGHERVRCVDLANFAVKPSERGKGYFRNFLNFLEQEAAKQDCQYIYIENVFGDPPDTDPQRLWQFFMKHGYECLAVQGSEDMHCFWKSLSTTDRTYTQAREIENPA
jgi:GNAT superfamily N-acetyltransferase